VRFSIQFYLSGYYIKITTQVVTTNSHALNNCKHGSDKSLARPGRRQASFPVFYGNCRFITAFTTAHHLSLPKPNQYIPPPITILTVVACFLPGRVKDLSAPGICVKLCS